jgi:hypothetical protein
MYCYLGSAETCNNMAAARNLYLKVIWLKWLVDYCVLVWAQELQSKCVYKSRRDMSVRYGMCEKLQMAHIFEVMSGSCETSGLCNSICLVILTS